MTAVKRAGKDEGRDFFDAFECITRQCNHANTSETLTREAQSKCVHRSVYTQDKNAKRFFPWDVGNPSTKMNSVHESRAKSMAKLVHKNAILK